MMSARSKVAVIGAGLMGHGIAQVFAVHDHTVTIFDADPKVLDAVRSRIQANLHRLGEDASALDRLRLCPALEQAVAGADFVVEAAPEDLKLKRQLFKAIDEGCLGMKSGQGFHNWHTEDIAALEARMTRHLRDAQRHEPQKTPHRRPE